MYDRRAIMTAAHRHYEERAAAVTARVAETNETIKRSRAQVKPMLRVLAQELRSLWRTSLRAAWANAKRALPRKPVSKIESLRHELAYVEAADRGFDHRRAAALRDELLSLQMAA